MLEIIRNKILYRNSELYFEDLFTQDFFDYCNKVSLDYNNNTYYVNEIYYSYVLKYLALDYYIKENKIIKIKIKSAERLLYSIGIDIAVKNNIIIDGYNNIYNLTSKFHCYLYTRTLLVLSSLFLLLKIILIPYKKEYNKSKTFAIVRFDPKKSKLVNFDFPIEFEDINNHKSIYRLAPRYLRLVWIIQSLVKSFRELRIIQNIVISYIGNNTSLEAQKYYSKRLVHTLLYRCIHNFYFKMKMNCNLITTVNLERFSIIEDELARKYNIFSTCIPHGLEYGFKFPRGFSCDLHYTNSENAAIFLNRLYGTNKFVFDFEITNKMFRLNKTKNQNECKVVFFTEPREVYVNQIIIEKLLPLLDKSRIKLFLKLHPKDLKTDYTKFNISIIDNFEEAIIDNICFSRKSTILLEAIYNDSSAASILINSKDKSIFHTFPSLQTEKIKITESIPELYNWILTEFNSKYYDQ